MDLVVFEQNKPYVIDEFRQGRFDYIELASDVVETRFFQFLFSHQVVQQLAASYPSPRDRHHVPLWMYVSSQLSMRLHGVHSFHRYPLIVRSGGLIDALSPHVARRQIDEDTGDVGIWCAGFNRRNAYARKTPCDQDYLRKLAKDTDADRLQQWYNEQAARAYADLGAYDAAGVFVGDGSYLFVPDNARYEGSMRLLFDEHHHPVDRDRERKMTKAQRDRCQWRRCYKAVFLLHCDWPGDRFVVAGVRVLSAKASEAKALWELVDTFVGAVGRGVMKTLVLDRGFIDGPQIGHLKQDYGVDVVIPVRSDMDILEDVRGMAKLGLDWHEYQPRAREALEPSREPPPGVAQRERKRHKTVARQRAKTQAENPADPSKVVEHTWVAKVEGLRSWSDCPVPLTGVLNKDVYADGHEDTWLLVTPATGQSASHTRHVYGLRTDIEERHRQVKCFWDLTRFQSTAWTVVVNQTVFVALTYSLLQIHLLQQGHEALNRRTWDTTRRLLPDGDRVIIYRQQYFAFLTLMEHTELALSLEGKAQRKARAKVRRLQREANSHPT